MRYTKDDLYLLVDFLEEQLDNERDMDYQGYSEEELDEFAVKETMFEMSIDVVKSILNEM
jgi:hypothetical protein